MKELIYFSDIYKVDEYDNEPLPVDIYNSEGAVLKPRGQKLSKERLLNAYIYHESSLSDKYASIDDTSIDDVLSDLDGLDLKSIAENGHEFQIEHEAEKESVAQKKEEPGNFAYERPGIGQDSFLLTDDYEEESAEEIVEKLEKLDFVPLHDIKIALRQNVHQLKSLFQKTIVDNVVSLDSKDNEGISRQVANYLDNILDNSMYASDYIDMIHSTRSGDNYHTFSHACSVAFYSLAIVKKLKIIREDFDNGNLGRWIPIKTKKNNENMTPVPISTQILRYIDNQKMNIQMKFKSPVKEILFESLHNIIYEYLKIDPDKKYPSMGIDFENTNREVLTMAALNHDLGKITIPNNILNKKGVMTRSEFMLMSKHPAYSVAKLKEVGVDMPDMFAYILGHHRLGPERGYPPLKKAPPPESTVIAIADVYDAMRAPRHHGNEQSQNIALGYLQDLFEEGCFDMPLYICAIHTFEEYNNAYVKTRIRKSVEL